MKKVLAVFLASTLSGCFDADVDVTTVCEDDLQFCRQLMEDVRCGKYRDDLIVGRHHYLNSGKAEDLYAALRVVKNYQKCSHLAELHEIRVITNKEKALKFNDLQPRFIEAQKSELYRLKKQYSLRLDNNKFVKQIKTNLLTGVNEKQGELFYLIDFLEHRDANALNKLKELEELDRLTDYRSYYYIAQEKARHNHNVLPLLLKGISIYPQELYLPVKQGVRTESLDADSQLHFSFLREIVTIHYKAERYDKAYIFANLLAFNNDSLSNIEMIASKLPPEELDSLKKVATVLHERLISGTFTVKS